MAWKREDEEEVHLLPFERCNLHWKDLPSAVRHDWLRCLGDWDSHLEDWVIVAHNAGFERAIYENILVRRLGWPEIHPLQWRCTAARAAAVALPRSLEGVGEVLKLTIQKDRSGAIAMMRTCRPSREWTAWQRKPKGQEPRLFIEPDSHPEVFEQLYHYCKRDVLTEELVDRTLPDLTTAELEVWRLNQEMNFRGFRVDLPLIHKIVEIMAGEEKQSLHELDELTMGLVTRPAARSAIIDFLRMEGIELQDIRANTVQDALESGKLTPVGRRLLELRQLLSKTSTKKYKAFIDRTDPRDWRVRDIQMYHGASTGRDSGTGVQIQNFPRPVIPIDKSQPYAAVENVRDLDVDMLRLLYGENLGMLFSSILRNMIIPTDGHELFVSDFSKIEVAVGWWLAENRPGIEILRLGGDPYKRLASINSGIPYEQIDDDSHERQLAKHQILGCQYGMGWEKFQRTGIELHRLHLSDDQSKAAVRQYRETFPAVPAFWRAIEQAAIEAVLEPGRRVRFPHGAFIYENRFLWLELPSKRRIAYREPRITTKINSWGEEQPQLEYWAVNPKTKKWNLERSWGGVLMENAVQGISRDIMVNACLELRRRGYWILFSVHDEIVGEKECGQGSIDEFNAILCQRPQWADEGLIIEAKGYQAMRYRK